MTLDEKYQQLKKWLKDTGGLAIAFSAGVDSTFLLDLAQEVLGDRLLAVTVKSPSFPRWEYEEALEFCRKKGIRQTIVEFDALQVPGFRDNPPDRCYHCKRELFARIRMTAEEAGIALVADGSNKDDEGDYRPGLKAIEELKIQSPLREFGFTKAEIRQLSAQRGLATADKPSFACLASRFVYGQPITEKGLKAVEQAETCLAEYGFHQFRVRVHGDLARIEVLPEEMDRFYDREIRLELTEKIKACGFSYVALDLQGYRTGSMNETLS